MSQAYHCLPTDLWHFDPTTPKGFYFNRGVFYFGRKVQSAMDEAENRSKSGRSGVTAVRLGNAAKLKVMEQMLGISVKRFRDPGAGSVESGGGGFVDSEQPDKKEGPIVLTKGF